MHYRFAPIKSCRNLKKYQKKQKMLKLDEVQKRNIVMSWRPPGLKIGKSLFFLFFLCTSSAFGNIFWFFFGTSSGFGNKIVPKPEEVPKKSKCFLLKPEQVPKNQKNRDFPTFRPGGPPSHVFFLVFWYLVMF